MDRAEAVEEDDWRPAIELEVHCRMSPGLQIRAGDGSGTGPMEDRGQSSSRGCLKALHQAWRWQPTVTAEAVLEAARRHETARQCGSQCRATTARLPAAIDTNSFCFRLMWFHAGLKLRTRCCHTTSAPGARLTCRRGKGKGFLTDRLVNSRVTVVPLGLSLAHGDGMLRCQLGSAMATKRLERPLLSCPPICLPLRMPADCDG